MYLCKVGIVTETDIENMRTIAKKQGSCSVGVAVLLHGEERFVGVNQMLEQDDPTAHAAIVITRSQHRLIRKNSSLALLLSEKPCPMCVSAICRANINDVYYLENNNTINRIELKSDNMSLWYEEIHTHQKNK